MALLAPGPKWADECRFSIESAIVDLDYDDIGRPIDGPRIKTVRKRVEDFRDALVATRSLALELPLESRLLEDRDWWPEKPEWKQLFETIDVLLARCEKVVGVKYPSIKKETRKRRAVYQALGLYAFSEVQRDAQQAGKVVENLAAILLDDPSANLYRDRLLLQKRHPHFWPFPQAHTDAVPD